MSRDDKHSLFLGYKAQGYKAQKYEVPGDEVFSGI